MDGSVLIDEHDEHDDERDAMSDTTGPEQGQHNNSEGEEKAGGLGQDGTIPPAADGIAAGMGDEDSNFNAEEDPADSH